MAASIVVAFRKALVAGITTALNDPGVAVTYGWQGGSDDRRREQVFTLRPRATHEVAGLKAGRNFRQEEIDLDIVVLVSGVNKTPEETDTRALEIGKVVEEFIADRKNNELAIAGLQWMRVTGFELNNMYGQSGSMSEITYTLRYHARLT